MAVNFLEMNDSPDKFEYFKRFIDEDKLKEMIKKEEAEKEQAELRRLRQIHSLVLEKKKAKKELRLA